MRIGIDARLAGLKHGGIGRYTEELLRHVVRKKTHQWVVFLSEKGQLPWLEKLSSVTVVYAPIRHYTVAEQIKMPQIFAEQHLDLLHVPHFNVPLAYDKPYVVTIHDLLWHERRDRDATTLSPFMHMMKYHAYRFVSEMAIRNARAVFVPTQYVQKIVQTFAKKQRVVITPEGISETFTLKGKKEKRAYPYLVYTGSLYPHKNVSYILDMLLGMQELHLVVVSGRSVFQKNLLAEIKKRSLEDRVHLEESLEDSAVAALYRGATAVVIPSFSEGFGLPGLEAMACGALVLASDIPVFREVYEDGAVFIDPQDPTDGIRVLTQMLNHNDQRLAVLDVVKRVTSQYSWEAMAEKTLQTYESLGK